MWRMQTASEVTWRQRHSIGTEYDITNARYQLECVHPYPTAVACRRMQIRHLYNLSADSYNCEPLASAYNRQKQNQYWQSSILLNSIKTLDMPLFFR